MRWNPFRRDPVEDATSSAFEATVAEDLVAVSVVPESPANGSAGTEVGATTLPVKRPVIGHVGRYALKAVLGEGGLGTVYAAWDPLLSRAVAVKTLRLHADTQALGTLDDLILNEARAAARLSHPHIVTVFDAGPSDQGIYIAMEPLRGRDLRHMLHEGWRPSPIEAAQIVRRVADALAYAHGKGVVHCDIKPANIFMVGKRSPKVLDFGIARIAHREAPSVEGPVAGSPYYLAPEQLRGEAIDRRCDVYSLGVVLYELLTGQRPFTGQTLEQIHDAVLNAPTPLARQANPKVPAALAAIVARAMSREPSDRYPSARHLSVELRQWLEHPEARALAESPAKVRRRRLTLVAIGAGAAALAALVQMAWQPWADREAAATAAPAQVATVEAAPVASAPVVIPEPTPPVEVAMTPETPASQEVAVAAAAPPPRPAAPPKERKPRASTPNVAPTFAAEHAPSLPPGLVQLAVSPWGQVEVDGAVVGIAPPLNRLSLPAGSHTITIRNGELPPLVRVVEVSADHPVTIKHRFEQ
ncbi:protein kinase domain-containing protein [Ideonella sp. YS5]|uniref:serine/threonine-protein kinase n=1 Tax=Ideonella sp. YS5 TaxID=3453714 RepID=UPI003EE9384D